jgi:hypothetical protein
MRSLGTPVSAAAGDLGSDEEASAVARRAMVVFGGLDILVTTVGYLEVCSSRQGTPRRCLDVDTGDVASAVRLIQVMVRGRRRSDGAG